MPIEGGDYTPPVGVQYAIRTVRVAQALVALSYFFGEQAAAAVRRPTPRAVLQMHDNPMLAIGGAFALDVVAQTLQSINAFEVTYNGQKLHSKLATGRMPQPVELVRQLETMRAKEKTRTQGAAEASAPKVRIE